MSTHRTTVGPRGRVTISAEIRREVGIEEGDEVILRPVGLGVVIIETLQAVKDRIRSGVPADHDGTWDATKDVRELRDGD